MDCLTITTFHFQPPIFGGDSWGKSHPTLSMRRRSFNGAWRSGMTIGFFSELEDPRLTPWVFSFTIPLYFLYLMCIPIREICKPNTSSIYVINLYLIFSSIVSFNCLVLILDLCWIGLTTLLDACLGISLIFTFMACRVEIDMCSWLRLGVD